MTRRIFELAEALAQLTSRSFYDVAQCSVESYAIFLHKSELNG